MSKHEGRVRVYFNLRKKCYSVQHYIKGKGWRLWYHLEGDSVLYLKDVSFAVSQKGRERVIREKQKNVHAYIIGTKIQLSEAVEIYRSLSSPTIADISYNPYLMSSFQGITNQHKTIKLMSASLVTLAHNIREAIVG